MGGIGSGTFSVQRRMRAWYKKYREPPGSTDFFQYQIQDGAILSRATASAIDAVYLARTLPRLDLLVIAPDEIRIVELKQKASAGELGQMLQYMQSLKRDRNLGQYLRGKVRYVLCVLQENANVRALCDAQGIEYLVIPASELPEVP